MGAWLVLPKASRAASSLLKGFGPALGLGPAESDYDLHDSVRSAGTSAETRRGASWCSWARFCASPLAIATLATPAHPSMAASIYGIHGQSAVYERARAEAAGN